MKGNPALVFSPLYKIQIKSVRCEKKISFKAFVILNRDKKRFGFCALVAQNLHFTPPIPSDLSGIARYLPSLLLYVNTRVLKAEGALI